nr:hypothetical protein [Mycoplasmopsis bovis]
MEKEKQNLTAKLSWLAKVKNSNIERKEFNNSNINGIHQITE